MLVSAKINKLINNIRSDKWFLWTGVLILLVLAIRLAIGIELGLLGFISLLAYWLILGVFLAKILRRVMGFCELWSLVFGFFLAIYLTSFGMAFWVVFYKITVDLMMGTLAVMAVAIAVISRRLKGETLGMRHEALGIRHGGTGKFDRTIKTGWWIGAGLLFGLAAILLFSARTGEYILTAWARISPIYSYLYIILTFFVLSVIFSRHKIKIILLVIILHSFLLHSYLPIVYETGFEGDKWRHVAAEKWLASGKIYSPSLFGEENRSYKKIGPIKIPEVFVVGNKNSYSNQWGLTILLGLAGNIDFFWVDFFLGFILWSFFVPLFLFYLGKYFSRDKTFSLFLAFAPSLFYPFQVYGGITVPVAFGFLYFMMMAVFWLRYLEGLPLVNGEKNNAANNNGAAKVETKKMLVLLLALTGLMYFNYLIYFILTILLGMIIIYFKRFILPNLFKEEKPAKNALKGFLILIGLSLSVIPLLDLAIGVSSLKIDEIIKFWLWPVNFLEFVLGKILGFEKFMPLPIFISQGNFIMMQLGQSLSKATLFSLINWGPVISLGVWMAIVWGIIKSGKIKCFRAAIAWILMLAILIFYHFISMYYMAGVRLISKRLDLTIAFFLLPLFCWGAYSFIVSESRIFSARAKVLAMSLILALASGVIYASGPKLETVTGDELKAAKYVVKEIRNKKLSSRGGPASGEEIRDANGELVIPQMSSNISNVDDKHCVLANTWPLLAVEMVSGREIVGGGFPVYIDYAQPERVQFWKKMTRMPAKRYIEKARKLTGADDCYFMVEKKWLGVNDGERNGVFAKLKEMFGEYKQIGEVYVFYYRPLAVEH